MRSCVVIAILLAASMSFGAFKTPRCKTVTQQTWTTSYNNCIKAYEIEAQDRSLPPGNNKELCDCITDEFFLKNDCTKINDLLIKVTKSNPFDARKSMAAAFASPITFCRERIRIKANDAAVKAQAGATKAGVSSETMPVKPPKAPEKK